MNCSTVCRRLCEVMVALSCWPPTDGRPPSWPAVTCVFWVWIAAVTSLGIRLYLASLSGSSQMRMAYSAPNNVTCPTPATRLIGSLTEEAT
ncbi:hypothetical protein ABIF60_004443 [Bradyrhizobium japonicum]